MNGGIYSVAFSLASAASVFIQLCKCASTTFNILVAINGNIFYINNLVEAHSFVLNEQQSGVRATYITLYSAVDKDLWVGLHHIELIIPTHTALKRLSCSCIASLGQNFVERVWDLICIPCSAGSS